MSLTAAQQATLKTDAQTNVAAAVAAKDMVTAANFYNAASAVNVWIPNLPRSVLIGAANWASLKTAGAVSIAMWQAMTADGIIDATQANVRTGFGQIFSGPDLTALSNIAQRTATRLEVLFGSGGPPITSSLFGYVLSVADAQAAILGL